MGEILQGEAINNEEIEDNVVIFMDNYNSNIIFKKGPR